MARKYHTLLQKQDGRWGIYFGDYDRECVVEEMRGVREQDRLVLSRADYKASEMKIITTGETQAEINAAVDDLNAKVQA